MPTTRVLVLRHGQSTWNAEGRWQGWADPPLSALGEEQAHDTVEHLRNAGITHVITSDLQRARRTGEIIAAGLGVGSVEVEPDIRERSVGRFQGHTGPENKARFPDAWDGDRVVAIPEGESDESVLERVVPALLRIAHGHPDGTVLAVSHGGVLRILERHLGATRNTPMPNLGGRWFDVCDGGRIDVGDLLVTVDAEHVTRPREE